MKYAANLSMAVTAIATATLGYCATASTDSAGLSFPVRIGLALVAAGGLVVWMLASLRHRRIELKYLAEFGQYLEGLHSLSNQDSCPAPPAGLSRPVKEACESLRSCVVTQLNRLDEASRLRAAAESRVGRHADEAGLLRQVVRNLPAPTFAVNQYDELIEISQPAEQLLHVENSGEGSLLEALPSQDLVNLLQETRQRKSKHRTAELALGDEAGVERRFRAVCTQLKNENSHGQMIVLTDVSNETAIQKRNAEFVSSVSHEMKTPLASIKAYSEMLADGEVQDDEIREEFLQVISNQADRLHRLVDNLLNLARIEAGVVHVSKTPMALNDLLNEACNVVQPRAEEKQIAMSRDLSPMYLGVLIDRDMMLQGVINLLSNAVKYTPEGGSVTLRSRLQDERIVIEVEDTGVGLEEEDCQRVFDKFYRVKEQADMAAGTGLGLPLTKHIIEDVHSGRLSLTSELGQGSVFRIELTPHQAAAPAQAN